MAQDKKGNRFKREQGIFWRERPTPQLEGIMLGHSLTQGKYLQDKPRQFCPGGHSPTLLSCGTPISISCIGHYRAHGPGAIRGPVARPANASPLLLGAVSGGLVLSPRRTAAMLDLVMFQGGSRYLASAASGSYSQVSQSEVWVRG
jgi:hypothetical protein